MLYCTRCQVLSTDGDRCPLCGGKKLRPARADDPVLLLTTGEGESRQIAAAFDDAGIPHMERPLDTGSASSIILGQSRCSQTRVFVPFGEIGTARDVLTGIGFLHDGTDGTAPVEPPERKDGPDGTAPAEPPERKDGPEKTVGRGKRLAVRILSVLLFAVVVTLVVFLADGIAGRFKSLFH
jgi:hypothetical protein